MATDFGPVGSGVLGAGTSGCGLAGGFVALAVSGSLPNGLRLGSASGVETPGARAAGLPAVGIGLGWG